MFTIFLSPCPLRRSISTVDRFFFGMRAHRRYRPIFWYESIPIFGWNRRSIKYRHYFQIGKSLSTVDIDCILKLVNPYRPSISTVFSSMWILIDRRYRPYSQVGESLSTVDIDRDRSTGRWSTSRLKSNRPMCVSLFCWPDIGDLNGGGITFDDIDRRSGHGLKKIVNIDLTHPYFITNRCKWLTRTFTSFHGDQFQALLTKQHTRKKQTHTDKV